MTLQYSLLLIFFLNHILLMDYCFNESLQPNETNHYKFRCRIPKFHHHIHYQDPHYQILFVFEFLNQIYF